LKKTLLHLSHEPLNVCEETKDIVH